MKMKILTAAVISAMLTLTACGETDKADTTSEKPAETTTTTAASEEVTTEAVTEEVTTETTPAVETTVTTTIAATTTTQATTTPAPEPEKEEFKLAAGLSEKYADIENPAIAYKGHILKFGEATVQDFLDAGVELFSDDIDKERVTSIFGVEAQVKINDTLRANLTFDYADNPRECTLESALIEISGNSMDTVSVDTNYKEDMVQFNFPLDLKIEDLLSNSGEPTELDPLYSNLVEYTYSGPSIFCPENERHRGYVEFTFNSEKDMLLRYYIDCNANA
ncbi:MAG: hypothetical protein J6Z29_04980 [Ruminococcus sp.]|nr:hypothetical protein [Ruminococcus sp.]